MEKIDAVVEANRALLLQRSQVGIKKYGTALDDANLSQRQLVQHMLEELLDGANYAQALLQTVCTPKAIRWRNGANDEWRYRTLPESWEAKTCNAVVSEMQACGCDAELLY